MAIVLTVHLVESIWSRPKQSGLLSPYLVVDHNGLQQQTDIARASNVTAWNQKATFPYVPTADLNIMAFDAGRHPGAFIAQATVDVASMLQAGSLSASAPLVNSTGNTIGHVLFDVELTTSSRAMAASLDIPGLTVTAPQRSKASSSRQMQPALGARQPDHLQEEHLSGSFTSFTMPSMQQRQQLLAQQQQQMQQQHGGGAAAAYGSGVAGAPCEQQQDGSRRLSQRIAKGAHELSSMLGFSSKRRNNEEPLAGSAAAAPRPVSPFAAVAGDAAAGRAADAQACFDSLPDSSAAAEHQQQQQQQQQHAAGALQAGGRPGSAGEVLSPLRSSRRQLKLSPSKMVQHAAVRHQQLLQARQQEERLLQRAADALQQLQGDAGAVDRSEWDDEVAREYDDADAAEKEAILYRQLVVQQAEKQAGTAQVLNIIAAQQQQEALHSSQLLAALAAMDSDSPRHIRAMVEALAATYSEEGYFHREQHQQQQQQQQQQQGSQMQQQAKAAVTAAVLRDRQRSRSASPDGPACYAEELRVSLSTSNNSMSLSASAASSPRRVDALRAAGLQQLGSPTTPCTPEFASPEMSFRTSYASSSQPLHAGAAAARMSTCSTASHSSAALPPPAAAAGLPRLDGSSSGSSGRGSYGSGFTAAGGSCGSVKSFPLANLELESEISEVISASSPKSAAAGSPRSPHYHALRSSTASTAAADAPAYRCAATGQESGSYCIVRNEQAEAAAAAQKAERWCMHSSMADAVPYLRPPPAFPFNSVPVGPSAPMG
ncbi:hypothetical protein OEZ85_009709 [Tetradesmus obliquus]|uniref:C2 domain-containing protein n=1 Tax=Tetradesmus obliquus TaxID=3088 RepID=A0ABY8UAA6_TETOB|nr:hypothetical protein OEZ85_009709 [Tetradesmus obliquus]